MHPVAVLASRRYSPRMREGFLAGVAFVIGAIVGTFAIAPIVSRQPQPDIPQAAMPSADPFENARMKEMQRSTPVAVTD